MDLTTNSAAELKGTTAHQVDCPLVVDWLMLRILIQSNDSDDGMIMIKP